MHRQLEDVEQRNQWVDSVSFPHEFKLSALNFGSFTILKIKLIRLLTPYCWYLFIEDMMSSVSGCKSLIFIPTDWEYIITGVNAAFVIKELKMSPTPSPNPRPLGSEHASHKS